MTVRETPAEPAAGPPAVAAAGAPRSRADRLRLALSLLGGVLFAAALLILTRELIAARVPQHRAALEDLIRHETGLEIAFSRLSVRWGWGGPEAVFSGVALGEPGAAPLLRTAQLVVGLDAWRSVRSGHLEAGRITLVSPDIDLDAPGAPSAPATAGAGHTQLLSEGRRVLARWRGGRVDIEGGTVRLSVANGAQPVSVALRRAGLRRLGSDWSGDAQLLLPDSLGVQASVSVRISGDPERSESLHGIVNFSGERLALGGWRFLGGPALAAWLPRAGTGNLELQMRFAAGLPVAVAAHVQAQALEWAPRAGDADALSVPRAVADLGAARSGDGWRVAVGSLDLGDATAHGAASLVVGAHAVRGSVHQIPLPALAALAHWYVPQLPLAQVSLGGTANAVSFDWDAQRPAGARLAATAQAGALALAIPTQDVVVSGLAVQLSATDAALTGSVSADSARLVLARADPLTLEGLSVTATLRGRLEGSQWQLGTEDLRLRRSDLSLDASARLAATGAGAVPRLEGRFEISDTDARVLAGVLGHEAVTVLGPAAARLSSGRITSATLELRAALPGQSPLAASRGALDLKDAGFAAGEGWPQVEELAARLDWQGARVRATVTQARSGNLSLSAGHAQWDAGGSDALRAQARVTGSAQEALAWLRSNPQLTSYVPGATYLDLGGEAVLDVDLVVPGSAKHQPRGRTRVTAVLDGAQLRPLAGLPPIESLRGTVGFADGRLQNSKITGQWLGGPVSLTIGERHDRGAAALAISGRGLLDVREALIAAGAEAADATLSGRAEWSAQLSLTAQAQPGSPGWRVRADSSLVGIASRFPEPLAKASNAALPLHLEAQGEDSAAELHLSLGERLQGIAALARSADRWRIERGTLRLAGGPAALPAAPVLALEGRVSRLDLPAYIALWQQAGRAPLLPSLEAHLSTGELSAGTRIYADATLTATAGVQGGEVNVRSPDARASLRWPALISAAHPALIHLAAFDAGREGDAALAAGLAELFAPQVQLVIDELTWQGRPLGHFSAALGAQAAVVTVADLRLAGGRHELRGTGQCSQELCAASLTLTSTDLAATLGAFGLRPDMSAQRARLAGELEWPAGSVTPLATLGGHLHMQLEEGATQVAAADAADTPFALWLVPALIDAMTPEGADAAPANLRFARLTAEYELRDGIARTANLHFDGDAEILVRGHVGLVARDYDGEAFVLRGEERLPLAVRHFGPTPKMAALWLSLRQWFTGSAAENARAVLRLRGTWNDPIVSPAE